MRELIALLRACGVETRTLVRIVNSDPPTVFLRADMLRFYARTDVDQAISRAIDDGELKCEFENGNAYFQKGR